MTSLADVAKRAGVSSATASRVLSGSSHPIRRETREQVHEAARELGFVPNQVARALATSRTTTVGVIVHDIADQYFAEVVRGLEDGVQAEGYQLFVCSSDRDPARELGYVEALIANRVDALVFAGGGLTDPDYQRRVADRLDAYRRNKGAVVALAPHAYRTPSVIVDNRGGAQTMTEHLASLGHKRIAFVSGPPSVETSAHRLEGYQRGLAAAGLPAGPELVVEGSFDMEGGRRAAADLLDRDPGVTAIFAATDVDALGVLLELRSRRVRVPDDVSVAGFGGGGFAALVDPPLTTMGARMHEVGLLGARMALRLTRGERVRSVLLPTELLVRASTGPPP
jgi:LacI family transcriptional regulator